MAEKLNSLLALAEDRGISRQELIAKIKTAVTREYKKRYPDKPQDVKVLLDLDAGLIRLYSDDKDVTPTEFIKEAEKIAQDAVLESITPPSESPAIKKDKKEPPEGKPSSFFNLAIKLLFYGYNGLSLFYIGIFFLGLLSSSFREFLTAIFATKGFYAVITLSILFTTPAVSTYLALKEKFLKPPLRLAKFFFLFEIPTILLSLFLFSLFTKPIPAVWLFSLFLFILPIVVFLKATGAAVTGVTQSVVSLVAKEIVALSSFYLTLLYSFFFPVIIGVIALGVFDVLKSFFGHDLAGFDIGSMIGLLVFLPFGTLGLLIITFLAFLPYILAFLTCKMFLEEQNQQQKKLGIKRAYNIVLTTAFITLFLIAATSFQANISPFLDQLAAFEKAKSYEAREVIARQLMPHENTIKQAIKDALKAPQRYFFVKDDDFLADAYEEIFNMPQSAAQYLQDAFSFLAYPFVYHGPTDKNGQLSSAYQALFGKSPYEDGYYPKTYYRKRTFERKNVRLLSRKVEAQTDYGGLLASISLEEEYENTASGNEEVIYEFSLPTEATIIDLRLGPDLEFPGIIAPRGAARRVYEEEIRRSRDPALLEQTGPRQYRLRVFPIPGKSDRPTLAGRNQRVKFTYVVGANQAGYPLPIYTKEENIIIDRQTQISFLLDGENVGKKHVLTALTDPATGAAKIDPCQVENTLTTELKSGDLSVNLIPHKTNPLLSGFICDEEELSLLSNINGKKIALFYDTSYQNKGDDFPKRLEALLSTNQQFFLKNKVDLYLFNDLISLPKTLTRDISPVKDIVYFGKSDLDKVLNRVNASYDMTIIVAHAEKDRLLEIKNVKFARSPVYFVHHQEIIPAYSTQLTNFVLQSGGQVVNSLAAAINHFAITDRLSKGGQKLLFVGPYWSITAEPQVLALQIPIPTPTPISPWPIITATPTPTPVSEPYTAVSGDTLSYLASKAYILQEVATTSGDIEKNTALLDRLNSLAEQSNVVTPYSSLIALVNEQQRARLEREKRRWDRYDVLERKPSSIRPPVRAMPLGDIFGAPMMFEKSAGIDIIGGGGGFEATSGLAPGGGGGISALPLILPLIAITGLLAVGGVIIFIFYVGRRRLEKKNIG